MSEHILRINDKRMLESSTMLGVGYSFLDAVYMDWITRNTTHPAVMRAGWGCCEIVFGSQRDLVLFKLFLS